MTYAAPAVFNGQTDAGKGDGCVLYLFIAGSALRSQRAVANVKRLCDEASISVEQLKIIDIFQQPALARTEQIIAVPTLVKKLPKPVRLFVGDMADRDEILAAIGRNIKEWVPDDEGRVRQRRSGAGSAEAPPGTGGR